jgi:hypothetical protein
LSKPGQALCRAKKKHGQTDTPIEAGIISAPTDQTAVSSGNGFFSLGYRRDRRLARHSRETKPLLEVTDIAARSV